jgi:hypothetical protein
MLFVALVTIPFTIPVGAPCTTMLAMLFISDLIIRLLFASKLPNITVAVWVTDIGALSTETLDEEWAMVKCSTIVLPFPSKLTGPPKSKVPVDPFNSPLLMKLPAPTTK